MLFVSGWSVADLLHAVARSAFGLGAVRFLLGAMEPANFPAGVKAISEWFPVRERALAVGIFNSGTAVGAALSIPVVSFIALKWGWRSAFVATSAMGFAWVALWAATYRPSRAPQPIHKHAVPPVANQLGALLRKRETWGCILPRIFLDPITYFLVFWVPKYLQEQRGFSMADLGLLGWIPFAALGLGNIVGGALPHFLSGQGWTVNRARKTTMFIASCLVPACCFLITKVGSPAVALGLLGGMMFGHAAWANVTLPSEVFPQEVVGTVSGLGGAAGGIFGILTQLSVGWIVQRFSFTPVFLACSIPYLPVLFAVNLLIPRLGRIVDFTIQQPAPTDVE